MSLLSKIMPSRGDSAVRDAASPLGRVLPRLASLRARTPSQMAEYARAHTRFYASLYQGYDTNRFDELPLLEKSALAHISPYDLLSDEYAGKVRYYGETTGSTGSPTPTFLTGLEFKLAAVMARMTPWHARLKATLARNRACVNGLAFGFTIAGPSFGDLLASMGGMVANVGSRSTLATPPRTARAITRLRPSVVVGAPVDFLSWMRIIRDDYPGQYEQVLDGIEVFISSAELCAPARQRQLEAAFGLHHINVFACVEGFFSLPCPCGEMHVLDIYQTELLSPGLEPLGDTGTGRLCFTNLIKRSTPMVRYLIDDWVTIHSSACPHGFTRSILPFGRYELCCVVGGRRINVGELEEIIFSHGLFGDFSLRLRDEEALLRLEDYAASREAARAARDHLEHELGMSVELDFVPFGTLTRYREVRREKPILKVLDERRGSTQEIPEIR